jgi:hypothetical protein
VADSEATWWSKKGNTLGVILAESSATCIFDMSSKTDQRRRSNSSLMVVLISLTAIPTIWSRNDTRSYEVERRECGLEYARARRPKDFQT